MTTALDIIKKSLQKNGVLTKNDTISDDEANDGLSALNAMLSSWSNESILIYARTLENFSLVAGQASYTIGPSGNFNTDRPLFIPEMHVRISNLDYEIISITDETYQGDIGLKSQQGIPQYFNYTNGYALGTINLWPVPQTNWTLFILSEKQLPSFSSLTQQVAFPPGWERALIYNLAVELAPEYGQQIDPMLKEIADDSKGLISRSILKNRTMDVEPQSIGRGNIFDGWYFWGGG